MNLSDTARERLEDVRELEPTSNSELRDRWDMDSGKEVARYLREELSEHVYRDDDSRIRAVAPDETTRSEHSSKSVSGSGSVDEHGMSNQSSGNKSSNIKANGPESTEHEAEVTMTHEEYDQVLQAARDAGYEDGYQEGLADAPSEEDLEEIRTIGYNEGYQDGYKAAREELGGGFSGRSTGDDPVCQKCGSELYDFRSYANGERHEVNGRQVYIAGDYQCASCGKWWVDEEPMTA